MISDPALSAVILMKYAAPLPPGAYAVDDDSLTLPDIGSPATVEIETICRPSENTRLEGLYVSNGTDNAVAVIRLSNCAMSSSALIADDRKAPEHSTLEGLGKQHSHHYYRQEPRRHSR